MRTRVIRVVTVLGQTVFVLWAVTLLAFLILEAVPGSTLDLLAPPDATRAERAAIARANGLDQPIVVRYLDWIGNALQGDFGRSLATKQSVAQLIGERVPVSLELALGALILAILIAVPLGVYTAYRPGKILDRVVGFLSSGALAVPTFLLAPILLYLLSVQLHLFPLTGYRPWSAGPYEHIRYMVLPIITLSLGEAVLMLRVLRSDMMATLREDFVVSARARGLSTPRILFGHALRPSSFSLVTVLGVSLGRLIGGSVIVESIFRLPGLGQLVVNSVNGRDVVTTQAVILVIALVFVLVNVLVNASYSALDPRVKGVA